MSTHAPSKVTSQRARLDALPEDIHYLIASELIKSSPSAVLALSQSSRTLRQAALPFVYRDVVLTQKTKKSWSGKAYKALVEIFREEARGNCDVAKHVRSIAVKDDLAEEDLMLILNQIAKCGTLKKVMLVFPVLLHNLELTLTVGILRRT
jgi:hypothetical protein